MRTRWWHVALLALALVPLFALLRWGGEARGLWGRPSDGLQARIACPRTLWRSGEPLEITLEVRNQGESTRTLPAGGRLVLEVSRDWHVWQPVWEESAAGGAGSGAVLPSVEVAPGQRTRLRLPVIPTTGVAPGWIILRGQAGPLEVGTVAVRLLPARKTP